MGPQKAELISVETGVFTYWDLINYFPTRHVDKSTLTEIRSINSESDTVQIRGKLNKIALLTAPSGKRLTATLTDSTGSIELIWFKNYQYVIKALKAS